MRRWFENLRIAGKVAVAPALAIIGLLLLTAGSYAVFGNLRHDFRYLNDVAFDQFGKAMHLQADAMQVHAQLYRITSLANANDLQQAATQAKAAAQGLRAIASAAQALRAADGDDRTHAATDAYRKAAQGVLDMISVDPAMALMLMSSAQDAFDTLGIQLNASEQAADRGRAATFTAALHAVDRARLVFLLGAAALAMLAAAASLVVTRAISRPVAVLTQTMRALAGGERALDIHYRERRDEVGDMARAVLVFQQHAIDADRLGAEQETARIEKENRQAALQRLTREFGDTIGEVTTSLGNAADAMRHAAEAMARAAAGVRREAAETAQGAARSSHDLNAVAAAVEQLSASVTEIAQLVTTAAQVARQAVQCAESSRVSMQDLTEAAHHIGAVVQLVSDIAGRTNLLALNATIEAARAGEAGKGFAVVAGEVKALASQTARATADIGRQIGTVRASTETAVSAMAEIGGMIARLDQVTAAISAAVEEQSVTTRQIASNIQSVSATTEQAASAMGQVERAAQDADETSQSVLNGAAGVGDQAETLRAEVERFVAAVRA